MGGQGHRTFVEALARFAAGAADRRVTAITKRAAAPLRVVVRGRRGVGRRTVAGALSRAGLLVSTQLVSTQEEDVLVYVINEVLKPEDSEAIAAARNPVLAVLNKADLAGSLSGRGGDGPIAAARARCAQLSTLAGVPMEPMIGLLAGAGLDAFDQDVWTAVRLLARSGSTQALFERSCDGFLALDNPAGPVPIELRQRLLDSLDLFGTALAVAAVRRGATAPQVRALLRRVSGVDAVVHKIGALGAEARYRRVLDAVAELEALAVTEEGIEKQITEFLSHDDTLSARMAAAMDVAEAAGLDLDILGDRDVLADGDDSAAHLQRATRWQRYSLQGLQGLQNCGPVNELHRACGADIARASLRLWSQTCGSLP